MATLYFHIGTPKTGTTHIQNLMWNNADALAKQGYVYPHFEAFPGIGKARNGYFLKVEKNNSFSGEVSNANQEIFDKNFVQIEELSRQYENIILSDEGMWNMSNAFMERFYKGAKKCQVDVKIIVYLRKQDLYLQSAWAQKVKESSCDTFKDYIKKEIYKRIRFDYFERLNEIADVVGKDNLIVRVYEKSQFINHNLTDDFFQMVGLQLTPDFIMPERVYNPSLGGPYLEVKRLLNSSREFAVLDNYAYPLLKKVMEDKNETLNFSSSKYLTNEEQKAFMSHYEVTNSNVAREFLGRSDGQLFMEDCDSDEVEEVKYDSQELIDICGQTLSIQRKEYLEKIAECKQTIKEQQSTIKKQQSTIDWVTTSFPKKVVRKLKRMAGIK